MARIDEQNAKRYARIAEISAAEAKLYWGKTQGSLDGIEDIVQEAKDAADRAEQAVDEANEALSNMKDYLDQVQDLLDQANDAVDKAQSAAEQINESYDYLVEQVTNVTRYEHSPIHWHPQVVTENVEIPANMNAWSFGPEITIAEGVEVKIGENSYWTIADGKMIKE